MTESIGVARVVGSGGLLGTAVVDELRRHQIAVRPTPGLDWTDSDRLRDQFQAVVGELRERAAAAPWAVFWCAGKGHVGAAPEVHESDQQSLRSFLDALVSDPPAGPGVFVLASSAGAVYSGNERWPVTEATAPVPRHAYGTSKLAQEAIAEDAVRQLPAMRGVTLRISNLYGAGQAIGKPQGLLSHLVANTFRRVPSSIYVPLDTSRDYLFTTDAAAMALRAARHAMPDGDTRNDHGTDHEDPAMEVRILAAEQSHTIAQILGILERIVKRPVPVSSPVTATSGLQPPILSFRSNDLDQRRLAKVSIEEGIARLVAEFAHARPMFTADNRVAT